MANVRFFRPLDMEAQQVFFGDLTEASATRIIIDSEDQRSVYEGSFSTIILTMSLVLWIPISCFTVAKSFTGRPISEWMQIQWPMLCSQMMQLGRSGTPCASTTPLKARTDLTSSLPTAVTT